MDPAGRFQDRPRLAIGFVQLVVAAVSVGLENPGVVGEMRLGMLAGSIARVIEHRRRRRGAAERPIVAHVDPTSPGVGLALGQDRHGGVIAVQSLGREDMGFNTPEDRLQHRAAGPHLVGQGRQAQRHAFPGIAFGLAVERLMLAELLEQDHRQKAGTGPASGDHMERRRRLADLLAVPAGELLADMLDHLPLARDQFQRLGDILAQLAQPLAAAARQAVGPGTITRSRGRCSGNGLRAGRLRVKAATVVVLATAISAAISSSVAELSSSSNCNSI